MVALGFIKDNPRSQPTQSQQHASQQRGQANKNVTQKPKGLLKGFRHHHLWFH
jgi:hypothetical protein